MVFDTPDARHLLSGKDVVYAHHPTNRNLRNLVRDAFLAWMVVRRTRPRIAISTGAGVAVPFLAQWDNTGGRGNYVRGVDQPVPTMVTKANTGVVLPFLTQHYSSGGQWSVCRHSLMPV